jgi:putative endonuclease
MSPARGRVTARFFYRTGPCRDLEARLERHQTGREDSTRSGVPWDLVWHEAYPTRAEAMGRERQIKSWKSRIRIDRLVSGVRPEADPGGADGSASGRKNP